MNAMDRASQSQIASWAKLGPTK